jgi:hypothetical protein
MKGMQRKEAVTYFNVLFQHLFVRTEESRVKLQNIQFPGRDSNPVPHGQRFYRDDVISLPCLSPRLRNNIMLFIGSRSLCCLRKYT